VKTVKVKVDQKLYAVVAEKLPWLSYEGLEDFARDAIRLRFENLFALITN
jgi:hypothetical protein